MITKQKQIVLARSVIVVRRTKEEEHRAKIARNSHKAVENLLTKKTRSTFAHLCVIARHEMNAQPHATYADIVEGVKCAATRARIGYHQVHEAIDAVVASTRYRFHDPTTERRRSDPDAPPPAVERRRPTTEPVAASMTADGTVIRRSWESPSQQLSQHETPRQADTPMSLGQIFQELAKRAPFMPERTRDEKAS